MRRLKERYGDAFTVNVPIFGNAVVISGAAEIKQLFTSGPELADNLEVNLGRVLGSRSMFALSGDEHKRQRKLLVPPFHGRRLAAYERIVEEETARELASWPEGKAFATLPSMMRITLNAILRAVFGAEGAEFAELRELLPPFVTLGSRLAVLPIPKRGRFNPWRRFERMRREYDAIVDRLIAKARADGNDRDDVLSMMLQTRYDDGSGLSREEISDQLLTLLTAGHETTATTLAWAVERLRRHPALLAELHEDDGKLLDATILEVQRTRPVIDLTARQVKQDGFQLGRWTLPKGYAVLVSIALIHDDDAVFPHAATFDPHRFAGARPDLYHATMEMTVVLRTLLRDFTLVPTDEPDERWHSRGVAYAPAKGGRAIVRRRTTGGDS
jgi:cytochrome P450